MDLILVDIVAFRVANVRLWELAHGQCRCGGVQLVKMRSKARRAHSTTLRDRFISSRIARPGETSVSRLTSSRKVVSTCRAMPEPGKRFLSAASGVAVHARKRFRSPAPAAGSALWQAGVPDVAAA
jgi:hypothetical protein